MVSGKSRHTGGRRTALGRGAKLHQTQRCDLDPNLLDLPLRHPTKLRGCPDEVHHGVHALDAKGLAAKNLLCYLAQPHSGDFRDLAVGVDVDGPAIEFVGIFRSILNKQCLGKSEPSVLVRRADRD